MTGKEYNEKHMLFKFSLGEKEKRVSGSETL